MLNESGGGTFVPAEDASALRDEIMRLASLDPAKREGIGDAARRWIIANRQYSYLAQDFVDAVFPSRVGTCHAEPSA
jgi:hypothetical protein